MALTGAMVVAVAAASTMLMAMPTASAMLVAMRTASTMLVAMLTTVALRMPMIIIGRDVAMGAVVVFMAMLIIDAMRMPMIIGRDVAMGAVVVFMPGCVMLVCHQFSSRTVRRWCRGTSSRECSACMTASATNARACSLASR